MKKKFYFLYALLVSLWLNTLFAQTNPIHHTLLGLYNGGGSNCNANYSSTTTVGASPASITTNSSYKSTNGFLASLPKEAPVQIMGLSDVCIGCNAPRTYNLSKVDANVTYNWSISPANLNIAIPVGQTNLPYSTWEFQNPNFANWANASLTVTATNNICNTSVSYTLPLKLDPEGVWPGDVYGKHPSNGNVSNWNDNWNQLNLMDHQYLVRSFYPFFNNYTGYTRNPNVNGSKTTWECHASRDWNIPNGSNFPYRPGNPNNIHSRNPKHADCNGDGLINITPAGAGSLDPTKDDYVIQQNINLYAPIYPVHNGNNFYKTQSIAELNVAPTNTILPYNSSPNNFEINIGSSGAAIDSVTGVAFVLGLDGAKWVNPIYEYVSPNGPPPFFTTPSQLGDVSEITNMNFVHAQNQSLNMVSVARTMPGCVTFDDKFLCNIVSSLEFTDPNIHNHGVSSGSGFYYPVVLHTLESGCMKENYIPEELQGNDIVIMMETDVIPSVVQPKVLLQGSYNGSNAMNTSLGTQNLIPIQQPYNIAPWNYNGQETLWELPNGAVDWVLVELRDKITNTIVKGRKAGILLENGEIVGTNGYPLMFFEAPPGQYYVSVKHRNHLAVMSANPVTLGATNTIYDFTTSPNAAYGYQGTTPMANGKYGMYAGDGNGDGIINNTDKNDVWRLQVIQSGYKQGDFNLNGQVQNDDKNDFWRINVAKQTQVPQ